MWHTIYLKSLRSVLLHHNKKHRCTGYVLAQHLNNRCRLINITTITKSILIDAIAIKSVKLLLKSMAKSDVIFAKLSGYFVVQLYRMTKSLMLQLQQTAWTNMASVPDFSYSQSTFTNQVHKLSKCSHILWALSFATEFTTTKPPAIIPPSESPEAMFVTRSVVRGTRIVAHCNFVARQNYTTKSRNKILTSRRLHLQMKQSERWNLRNFSIN